MTLDGKNLLIKRYSHSQMLVGHARLAFGQRAYNRQVPARGVNAKPMWLVGLGLMFAIVLLAFSPGSAGGLAGLALVITVQSVAGAVLWAWARGPRSVSLLEVLGMGLAIGTLGSLLASQVSMLSGIGLSGYLVLPVLALVLAVGRGLGYVKLARVHLGAPLGWFGFITAFLAGVALLIPSFRNTPLVNGYVAGSGYHTDLIFFEALSQSLATLGPLDNQLLVGEPIRYHWFVYAWVGLMTEVSGSENFFVMTRILPILLVVMGAALAVAWSQLLSTVRWVPVVAAWLVVVAGYVGAKQGVILTFDSPSTGYAAVLALALALLLTLYVREDIGYLGLLLAGFIAFGVAGSKVSQGLVVLAGAGLLSAVAFRYSRDLRLRTWRISIVIAGAMILAFFLIIAGVSLSESNIAVESAESRVSTYQGLDAGEGLLGIVVGGIALLLAVAARWSGIAWLAQGRPTRWAPETVFGIGAAVSGILPLLILRSGTNAAWFAVSASVIVSVLSAVGLGVVLTRLGWSVECLRARRWITDPVVIATLGSLGIALLTSALIILADVSGAPVLWRAPVVTFLAVSLLALVIALRPFPQVARLTLRWAALATVMLISVSIWMRFLGPLSTEFASGSGRESVAALIRLQNPAAEFPWEVDSAEVSEALTTSPASSGTPRAEDGLSQTLSVVQWSPQLNDAALWLKTQVEPTDVTAMDGPLRQPFLPLVADARMLVAGLPYTSGYTTEAGLGAITSRESLTDAFLSNPSEATFGALQAIGVKWLWLQEPHDLAGLGQFGSLAYENDEVAIVRLNDPGANSG